MVTPIGFPLADLSIAADVAGPESAPLVLLLPGGGQTRHSWGGAVEQLAAQGFRVVSLDLRGHGQSGWAPDGDYALDRFVDDVQAVMAQLGRPAFLVGASLGGLACLVATGEGRVASRGLILVDVAPRIEIKGAERIAAFMQANADGFASLDDAADAVAAYQPHRKRPRDISGLRKNLREGDDGRFYWHWDPAFGGREISSSEFTQSATRLESAARALAVPTLLVRGGLSEVVSEQSVAEFQRLAPDAEVVNIASADHMVAGDRNDAFNQAVLDFLNRHK